MSVAWQDVIDVAPNDSVISGMPSGTQAVVLAYVNGLAMTVWGDLADTGRALLAAHTAIVWSKQGSPTGQVTGESVGSVSRQYAAPASSSPSLLALSSYGMEFLRLSKSLPGARFMVV